VIQHTVTSHYDVLGLPSTATTEEIKRSFRKLARQCHPDVIGWKDPTKLVWAEERFKAISYAHDTLIDPIKRSHYDKSRSDSRQMYSYAYGYVPLDDDAYQLTGAVETAYDLAWDEFISKPFGWVEKSLRFYTRWEFVVSLALVVGAIAWFSTGHELSTLEMMRFLVTTRSMPDVESNIPFMGGLISLVMAFVVTLASTAYALIMHPYSRRHNADFMAQLIDHASNMLAMLGVVCITAGLIIGYNFF
jgi:hypothetical protein